MTTQSPNRCAANIAQNAIVAIRAAGARYGLNLVAAIPAERYDAAVTPAYRTGSFASAKLPATPRSIVLIGNGGGDFTREIIEREVVAAARHTGARCVAVYPFVTGGPSLNFIELAKVTGLGGPSIIGVVLHPTYGPWMAFRAALIIDVELDLPGGAIGFDPCPTCVPRSCIAACPATAVAFPAGWDIPKCLTHRVEVEADCAPRCHARVACVVGPEHRYPDDELAYHHGRALGAMRPWYEANIRPHK
jgi:hypothetical protein